VDQPQQKDKKVPKASLCKAAVLRSTLETNRARVVSNRGMILSEGFACNPTDPDFTRNGQSVWQKFNKEWSKANDTFATPST